MLLESTGLSNDQQERSVSRNRLSLSRASPAGPPRSLGLPARTVQGAQACSPEAASSGVTSTRDAFGGEHSGGPSPMVSLPRGSFSAPEL